VIVPVVLAEQRQQRDARRAVLEPWVCDGKLRDGRPCGKTLMELDWNRPSYIRKICERCGTPNVFVEAYRSA
jgi:hypothetical protein